MKTRVIQDDPDDEPPLDLQEAQCEEPDPPLPPGDPTPSQPARPTGQQAEADDRPPGSGKT